MFIRSLVAVAALMCPMFAQAFETHASLGLGVNYNEMYDDFGAKGGLAISAGLMPGIATWVWVGAGENAKHDSWVSTSQGLDLTFGRITTGLSFRFSKDADRFQDKDVGVEQEAAISFKIKLW